MRSVVIVHHRILLLLVQILALAIFPVSGAVAGYRAGVNDCAWIEDCRPEGAHDHHATLRRHTDKAQHFNQPRSNSQAAPLSKAERQLSLHASKLAHECRSVCCDLMCHAMDISAGPYFFLSALVRAVPLLLSSYERGVRGT
jgi:hypothetical protein